MYFESNICTWVIWLFQMSYCNWRNKINLSFLQKITESSNFITNSVVHSYSSIYAAGKLKTNEDIIRIKDVYYESQLFNLHLNHVRIPSKVHLMGRDRCGHWISAKRTLPIRKRRPRNVNLGICYVPWTSQTSQSDVFGKSLGRHCAIWMSTNWSKSESQWTSPAEFPLKACSNPKWHIFFRHWFGQEIVIFLILEFLNMHEFFPGAGQQKIIWSRFVELHLF